MQSDYVSAFGIGGLITDGSGISNNTTTTTKPGVVSSDETSTEYRRTSPSRRNNQMYSKSSTMIASGPTTLRPLATADMLSETKRTRFNSVETPPTTTNTSSSSTDTVTPLHGLAAKAVSAAATATAAAATAVLRRSQSIKQAAQAKRKSALRSLSHTLPSSSPHHHHHHSMAGTNNNQNDNDQYELDDMRIKYESFCNRDEDDENDQDADVEDDDDDEPDENESLLHSSKQAAQIEPSIKDINNNLDSPNSSLLQNNLNTNNVDDSLKVVIVNSNGTIPGTTADKNNNVKVAAIKTAKRSDSVRMRHHSNISTINMGNNGGAESTSSSSRLKKYFKCRKNKVRSKASQRRHNYIVIILLFVVNLLNYIDRYTLAGVLLDVQDYFGINDSESGLLQTVFICSYMLLAPLFGYMGDRYSRKWIIIFGITFWSLMTFLGSLVPADKFWLFALIRSLVGIGEASYSCVAPTIIGDLFTNEMRTKMLAVFYLAVPVGSGLGYIVGSNIAQIFNNWKWALRFTPPLGFICVLLLVFVVQEPKRGGAESGSNENDLGASKSNIKEDVIYLLKNKTFMWITFGFTFASFVLGGLSWWVPAYVQYAIYSNNKIPDQIPLKFGVVTCLSGLFGVALSSVLAEKLRKKTPNADPLVCALGSLIAVPSLFILILLTGAVNEVLFWMIAAVAISAMCLSWTIVADVLLYAIYPHRRSIASALNILICHLFGDAGSPYVIGAISDALRKGKPDTYNSKFTSLQVALYAGPFFAALSFAAYLFTAIYVVEDKKDVDDFIRRSKQMNEAINGSGEEGNDKNFTSSNESTLNEMTSSRSKKISEHTAYLNPVAFTQETGTTNELQSNPK